MIRLALSSIVALALSFTLGACEPVLIADGTDDTASGAGGGDCSDSPPGSCSTDPNPGTGPGTGHVSNTGITLLREYWHIYAHADVEPSTYYMLPRPDGADAIAEECANDGPMAPTFRAAELCQSATSEAAVARINNLSLDEALAVSTFLHAHLRFEASAVGDGVFFQVWPYVYVDDAVEICERHTEARSGVLKSYCDWVYTRTGPAGTQEARYFTAEEAPVVADLMNELYGVPAP